MIFLRSKRLEKKTSDAREPSLYRSICTSIISTLLSLVMLVGTTFAWFTDNLTTGVFTITAGSLAAQASYCTELPDGGSSGVDPMWLRLKPGNTSMFGGMTFTSGDAQTAYLKLVNSSSGDVVYKFRFESETETETEGTFEGNTERKRLSDMLNFGCVSVEENDRWMTQLKGAVTTPQKLTGFAATSPGPFEVTVAQGQIVYVALTIAMDEYSGTWETQPSIQLRLQIDISNTTLAGESQTSRQLMAAPPIVMGVYNVANDSGFVTIMQTKPPVTEEAESNDTNVTGSDEVVANPNITETSET